MPNPADPTPTSTDAVVERLAEIADLMRTLIEDTVPALDSKIGFVEGKTDRRARIFRNLWVTGLVMFLLACAVGGYVAHRGFNDLARANRAQSCFQAWANATARRTETVSEASTDRIRALDHLLDVRKKYAADAPEAKAATREAAVAGDKYESIVRNNPPVPSLEVFCTRGIPRPSSEAPAGGSGSGAGATSASPTATSAAVVSSPGSSRSPATTAGASTRPAVERSGSTPRTTAQRTTTAPRSATPSTSPTGSPSQGLVPSLVCPILPTPLLCSETP